MAPQVLGCFESLDKRVIARFSFEQAVSNYVLSIDEFDSFISHVGSVRAELAGVENSFTGVVVESTRQNISAGNSVTVMLQNVAGSETISISINTGAAVRNYNLPRVSDLLRTLTVFHDKESTLFLSQSLEQLTAIDFNSRFHTLESVFSSASIKLEFGGQQPALPADNDTIWTAAELLALLKIRIPALRLPWTVWVFEATKYEDDAVRGILIHGDKSLKECRKGCAVFSGSLDGVSPARLRKRLWTLTHELGHCLNLIHTSRRPGAQPSCFLTDAASVTDSFWQTFDFEFNDDSLLDLHHSFFPTICPGETEFKDSQAFAKDSTARKTQGLYFEIGAEPEVTLNEPLLLQLKITNTSKRNRHFKNYLNPRWGQCEIAVSRDGWRTQYVPIIDQCGSPESITLSPGGKVRDFVWLHSNENGFLFPRSGSYSISAALKVAEKVWLHSPAITVKVTEPKHKLESFLNARIDAEKIRYLFEVQGSDCESLSSSMDAIKEIASDREGHRMTKKCASILAINSRRDFKSIRQEGMQIRSAAPEESSYWFTKATATPDTDQLLGKYTSIAKTLCTEKSSSNKR